MAHYHHGNLRESLIQAGDDELRETEAGQLSLRAISRRLNVSHNAPYRHFSDKDALISEILVRTITELNNRLHESELIYPYSPLHQIQYFGRAWALLSLRHPKKVELLFGSLRKSLANARLKNQFGSMTKSLTHLLQSCVQRGFLHLEDTKLTATALISALTGCSLIVAAGTADYEGDEEVFLLFDYTVENLLNFKSV